MSYRFDITYPDNPERVQLTCTKQLEDGYEVIFPTDYPKGTEITEAHYEQSIKDTEAFINKYENNQIINSTK